MKILIITILYVVLITCVVKAESTQKNYKPFDAQVINISTIKLVKAPMLPGKVLDSPKKLDKMPVDDGGVTIDQSEGKVSPPLNFTKVVFDVQFNIDEHKKTIDKTKKFTESFCTDKLIDAQVSQDVFNFYNPLVHFDNCRIEDSIRHILYLNEEVKKRTHNKEYQEAAAKIGEALHTIHDFYSHTNYVELMAAKSYPDITSVPIPHVWENDSISKLMVFTDGKLVSGTVWYEPGNICKKGAKTHAQMNKDKEAKNGKVLIEKWNVSRHKAALILAERASNEYMESLKLSCFDLFATCGAIQYISEIVNRNESIAVGVNRDEIIRDSSKKMAKFLSDNPGKYNNFHLK